MAETELERAERRFEQAKARLQALKNREATKQRKLDTRRKMILGGALVDLAERDDTARAMVDRLVRNLVREQDRKVFEEWSVGAADGGENSGAGSTPAEAERSETGSPVGEATGMDTPGGTSGGPHARLGRIASSLSSQGGERT